MPRRARYTKDAQFSIERETAIRLCEAVNTPRALSVAIMLRYKAVEEYLSLSIDPDDYKTASDFAGDYLVTEVLRKSPNLPWDNDTYEAALHSFRESEDLCRETNNRFNPVSSTFACPDYGKLERFPFWVGALREQIRLILGPLKPKLETLFEGSVSCGSGADIGLPGRGIIPSDKYDSPLSLSPKLVPFFKAILGDRWWEHQHKVKEVVDWNEFFTVLKDARKDRGACKEPRLNLFVQLSIAKAIRNGLRREGIDLDTQPDVNRELVCRAWRDGLATIDLSSASDTLSYSVVTQFFPEDWVHILELARSDKTLLPHKGKDRQPELVPLEKFSSMGNGFTFELETVLFLAVSRMIVPEEEWSDVAVFGDDIIVPQHCAEDVVQALELLGFKVNTKKTCLAGKFFESCGTDTWEGQNVRPFHLKGVSQSIPYELQIANKLRLWAHQLGGGEFCDARFKPVWTWLINRVPREYHECSVTPDLGDVGIIRSWSEARKRGYTDIDRHGTITTDVCVPQAAKKKSYTLGVLFHKLSGPATGSVNLGPVYVRHRKRPDKGYSKKLTLVWDSKMNVTYASAGVGGNSFPVRGILLEPVRGRVTRCAWLEGLDWH